jgi:hypothetical protein
MEGLEKYSIELQVHGNTLSQFSSMSMPPHSEKLIVDPNRSDTIEK